MNYHPAPEKILLVNVSAHATLYLAFSFLPYGFWCNYSILVQETQSAKDIDLTCFKMFPFAAVTCLHVGPMSLD